MMNRIRAWYDRHTPRPATKPKISRNGKVSGRASVARVRSKAVAKLLKDERAARREWYGHFNGGPPRKPYSKEARVSLNKLERAKTLLVKATRAPNFKDAARKLNYSPQYARRTPVAAGSQSAQ